MLNQRHRSILRRQRRNQRIAAEVANRLDPPPIPDRKGKRGVHVEITREEIYFDALSDIHHGNVKF